MPVIFPDTNETTGTARETSGATVPVTTSSDATACAAAVASGNCSGWSTLNRLPSAARAILAAGGASFVGSSCALPQLVRSRMEGTETRSEEHTSELQSLRHL